MRHLSASELLSLWEYGLGQAPWQRALSLLAAVLPDFSADALANLSIGRRDAYLLSLRENLFGPKLVSLTSCPACGERLELAFDIVDIRAGNLSAPDSEQDRDLDGTLFLSMDGYQVTFRLPNSLDLARIAGMSNREQARLHLLERCLISIGKDGVARRAGELPETITSAISGQMAAADPQGDVQIALTCPNCTHHWQVAFDILSFLWIEIHAWAQRILREVHILASTYGWREADIMALSPWRRQAYLQMVMG